MRWSQEAGCLMNSSSAPAMGLDDRTWVAIFAVLHRRPTVMYRKVSFGDYGRSRANEYRTKADCRVHAQRASGDWKTARRSRAWNEAADQVGPAQARGGAARARCARAANTSGSRRRKRKSNGSAQSGMRRRDRPRTASLCRSAPRHVHDTDSRRAASRPQPIV
jgi:hypothetical protein